MRQIEYDSWEVKINDTNPSFDIPVGFDGGIPDEADGCLKHRGGDTFTYGAREARFDLTPAIH